MARSAENCTISPPRVRAPGTTKRSPFGDSRQSRKINSRKSVYRILHSRVSIGGFGGNHELVRHIMPVHILWCWIKMRNLALVARSPQVTSRHDERERKDRGTDSSAGAAARAAGGCEGARQRAGRARGRAPGEAGRGPAAGHRQADRGPAGLPGVVQARREPAAERMGRGSGRTPSSGAVP